MKMFLVTLIYEKVSIDFGLKSKYHDVAEEQRC